MQRTLRVLALAVLLSSSSVASAARLYTTFVKAESDVATFDPTIFGPGPVIDVYHLQVTNPNAYPATSLSLSLSSPRSFINLNSSALTFKANANLPALGPFKVAESFFVVPNPATILAVGTSDTSDLLASSYTSAGGATFIPAGGTSVVAVLSVAAGSGLPTNYVNWGGTAAVNGVLEDVGILTPPFPEPTSGVLAGLGLLVAAARRRV